MPDPLLNAYLCRALESEGVACTLGSTRFHLEPDYFHGRGITNDPGLTSIASGLAIKNKRLRRSLRFLEFCCNLSALAMRFLFQTPDIIHLQWAALVEEGIPLETWFIKLVRRRGIKLVYTVHNVLPHDSNAKVENSLGEVYRLMDALICHTRETKDYLVHNFGLDADKIWLIPHGPLFFDYPRLEKAEAKRRIGLEPTLCVVLYQGLIRPYKGLDFLLEAWKEVQARQPAAKLVIAGRGEQCHMDAVKSQINENGLAASVKLDLRYLRSEEIPLYYQATDIAIYPYREITQSGALMTGIAFGKPIIATALPGFREALEDYKGAIYVEYGDVWSLSGHLSRLIANPQELEHIESRCKADSARSWRRIAQETKHCYEQVVSGSGRNKSLAQSEAQLKSATTAL